MSAPTEYDEYTCPTASCLNCYTVKVPRPTHAALTRCLDGDTSDFELVREETWPATPRGAYNFYMEFRRKADGSEWSACGIVISASFYHGLRAGTALIRRKGVTP